MCVKTLTVAGEVVPELARTLRLEDLDQHDVELHAFQTHPGEGGEEEVVEAGGDDAADDAMVGLLDAHHEDHLGDEEAQHQVLVDRVAVTLEVTAIQQQKHCRLLPHKHHNTN